MVQPPVRESTVSSSLIGDVRAAGASLDLVALVTLIVDDGLGNLVAALENENLYGRRGDAGVRGHAAKNREDIALDIVDFGDSGAGLDDLADPAFLVLVVADLDDAQKL